VGCHPVAVVTLHLNYVKPTKFKTWGLHEKHVVVTWNLGSLSAFTYRHRETKKNLCRDGRSQELMKSAWHVDTSYHCYSLQKVIPPLRWSLTSRGLLDHWRLDCWGVTRWRLSRMRGCGPERTGTVEWLSDRPCSAWKVFVGMWFRLDDWRKRLRGRNTEVKLSGMSHHGAWHVCSDVLGESDLLLSYSSKFLISVDSISLCL
jgi:hypothetical protein